MRIGFGNGGWIRVADLEQLPLGAVVYVRFRADERGRLEPVELYIDAQEPIAGAMLRSLPLHVVEGFVNAEADALMSRIKYIGPDLSRLASYFSTGFGSQAEDHWIKLSFDAQVGRAKQPRKQAPPPIRSRPAVPPLRKPDRITPEFLRHVAAAYIDLTTSGERAPAVVLAEQAGVAVKTVRSWIYLARKAEFLPPGTRGQAG